MKRIMTLLLIGIVTLSSASVFATDTTDGENRQGVSYSRSQNEILPRIYTRVSQPAFGKQADYTVYQGVTYQGKSKGMYLIEKKYGHKDLPSLYHMYKQEWYEDSNYRRLLGRTYEYDFYN